MNGRNAIGAMRTDNGEIGHANLACITFFHEADAFDSPFIVRKAHPNFIEQAAIDLVDDLKMAGEERFKPCHRPLLKGLGQQRVVGVGQRLGGQIPSFIPA